jgi:hypothetical protein
LRSRATVKPAKWLNLAVVGNVTVGKNTDTLVDHLEQVQSLSFAAEIIPSETWSMNFNLAHDDVFSSMDICYPSGSPLTGDTNSGTCTVANGGGTYLYRGSGNYDAPVTFFSAALNYAPKKHVRMYGGFRVNRTKGTAEMLNPNMIPGALRSKFFSPYADVEFRLDREWSWHGNWTHTGYQESGDQGILASRNTSGDVMTLGVKYAF